MSEREKKPNGFFKRSALPTNAFSSACFSRRSFEGPSSQSGRVRHVRVSASRVGDEAAKSDEAAPARPSSCFHTCSKRSRRQRNAAAAKGSSVGIREHRGAPRRGQLVTRVQRRSREASSVEEGRADGRWRRGGLRGRSTGCSIVAAAAAAVVATPIRPPAPPPPSTSSSSSSSRFISALLALAPATSAASPRPPPSARRLGAGAAIRKGKTVFPPLSRFDVEREIEEKKLEMS